MSEAFGSGTRAVEVGADMGAGDEAGDGDDVGDGCLVGVDAFWVRSIVSGVESVFKEQVGGGGGTG